MLTGVVLPLIGVVLAFFAGLAVARYQRRGQLTDARRNAYAEWLTSENLLYVRIKSVCDKLVGFPKDREKHAELVAQVETLANDMQALTRTLNEAYLAESSVRSRKQLRNITDQCSVLCDQLTFASKHYTENLEFHEYFSGTPTEELSAWPQDLRLRWQREKDRFEKHDAECPFKSDTYRQQVVGHIETLHEAVVAFQESLARQTSK